MADGPLKVTKPVLVNKLQPHMQFRRPTSTYELIAVTVKKMHKCSFSDLSLLISLWLLHYIGTHWDCIPKGNDTSFQACPFSTRRPNWTLPTTWSQATCVQRSGVDASGVRVGLGAATKHNRRMCAPPGSWPLPGCI